MADTPTPRELTDAEHEELAQRVRRWPRLVREGPGLWTLTFRFPPVRVARIVGSLPAVLRAAVHMIRFSRGRR